MDNIDRIEISLPNRPLNGDAKDLFWLEHLTTPGVQPGAQMLGPQEVSRKLRELANYIDGKIEPVPPDVNMKLAEQLAAHLVQDPGLPASIAAMTAEQKADLLGAVDKEPLDQLPVSRDDYGPFARIAVLLGRIALMTAHSIPDLPNAVDRINVVLRMWAASTYAGKTIAEGTRSGPTDAATRRQNSLGIETNANSDPVFAAGVEASVILKKRRGEKMSFDGVPENTRVHDLQKHLP